MDLSIINCVMQGKASHEAYIDTLLSTLSPARPPEYFVNWSKVQKNIQKYQTELCLLDSVFRLSPVNTREEKLREIFQKWEDKKKLGEALLLLVACRYNKKKPIIIRSPQGDVRIDPTDIDSLIVLARETGLLSELNPQNLIDYATGVEVGLDTHARKNRSGEAFEKFVCKPLLNEFFSTQKGYSVVYQDKILNLWQAISGSKKKKHDFVIYKGEIPIIVIECTYIDETGSKPTAIAESYPKLSRLAQERNLRFIWMIDGWGWEKQRGDLVSAVKEIDIITTPRMFPHIAECAGF